MECSSILLFSGEMVGGYRPNRQLLVTFQPRCPLFSCLSNLCFFLSPALSLLHSKTPLINALSFIHHPNPKQNSSLSTILLLCLALLFGLPLVLPLVLFFFYFFLLPYILHCLRQRGRKTLRLRRATKRTR